MASNLIGGKRATQVQEQIELVRQTDHIAQECVLETLPSRITWLFPTYLNQVEENVVDDEQMQTEI